MTDVYKEKANMNSRIYLAKGKRCFNRSKLPGPGGIPLRGVFAQMLWRKTYRDEGRAWLVIAKRQRVIESLNKRLENA